MADAPPNGYDACPSQCIGAPQTDCLISHNCNGLRDMNEDFRRRILWADDEIDLLRPHIKFLEQKGFEVSAVPNGEDAVAAIDRDHFDVVLLDEMMPGMGGLETLEAIKERDAALPVILVTKSEEETLMDDALGRHITDYLIKPVNPSQVFLACKRVFDATRLQDSQRARSYVSEMQRWQTMDLRSLDWRGWVDLAVEIARWDVRLDEVKDEGLKQAHGDFKRGLNIDFGRFIENEYPRWIASDESKPRLSPDVVRQAVLPHLRNGEHVTFVIIDCMRLDQWFTLEPLLEQMFEIDRDYYYGILPTATPYARNAIFAGLLPGELQKRHPDMWQEAGNDERTKNRFEREFLDLQLERLHFTPAKPAKYLKIHDNDEASRVRGQISSFRDLQLVSLVFNFLDILAHGRSESEILQELAPDEAAFRAVMKAWFLHSPLLEIFRALSRQNSKVVVTTDHGAILGRRAALVKGDRDTSTNLRYKFGLNVNVDPKQAIMVRNPAEYGLPDSGVSKNYVLAREDYYFVYPTRFHKYERQFRGSFQHGGVSVEEMILPLITLTPRTA